MIFTESENIDFKGLREKAGLTLETLAGMIDYSVAAVNGLENKGAGSKRLRRMVFEKLTSAPEELVGSKEGTADGEMANTGKRESDLERARLAERKLARVRALLAELVQVLSDDGKTGEKPSKDAGRGRIARRKPSSRPRRTRLRDVASVSLRVFGTIPAGWPQNFDETRCEVRYAQVPRGRFPEGAFGLDVRGDSMNAAAPEPIRDGETVVLLSPDQREPRHHDIVAALCDGQTTLKRLHCPPGQPCVLRAESSHPAFARDIVPIHDLTIQGVVVGKL